MEALVHELNESSSVSVLDDTDIVYVVRVPTRRIMTITLAVGTRLPAFVTSMGRVLLAALPPEQLAERLEQIELHKYTHHTITSKEALREELQKVARDGFAMVDQELEEGLRSIAVPIRDAAGSVAALNVSVHASRTDLRTLRKRFVPQVLAAAAAIENDIRGAGGSVG
jgi:IclR family pca regulon transcriptional regulator